MARRNRDEERRREQQEREERKKRQRRRLYVTPECCQQAIDTAAVHLTLPPEFCNGDLTTPPEWAVMVPDPDYNSWNHVSAKVCPFCAAPVPEIEKRQTTEKVMVVTDGSYYCDTCKERVMCCKCLPGSFHWQPKGSTLPIPPKPKYDVEDSEE